MNHRNFKKQLSISWIEYWWTYLINREMMKEVHNILMSSKSSDEKLADVNDMYQQVLDKMREPQI